MSHRDLVGDRVREILAETLHVSPQGIRSEDRLIDDLGVESVDLISLTFALEDAFGRQLEDEELQALTTVDSVIALLAAKTNLAAPQP